MVTFRRCRRPL